MSKFPNGQPCPNCCAPAPPPPAPACFRCFTESFTAAELLRAHDNVAGYQYISPLVTIPGGTLNIGNTFFSHIIARYAGGFGTHTESVFLSLIFDGDLVNPWSVSSSSVTTTNQDGFRFDHIGLGFQVREVTPFGPPVQHFLDIYSSGTAARGGAETEGFGSVGEIRMINDQAQNWPVGSGEIQIDFFLDLAVPHTFQWAAKFPTVPGNGATVTSYHNKVWVVG